MNDILIAKIKKLYKTYKLHKRFPSFFSNSPFKNDIIKVDNFELFFMRINKELRLMKIKKNLEVGYKIFEFNIHLHDLRVEVYYSELYDTEAKNNAPVTFYHLPFKNHQEYLKQSLPELLLLYSKVESFAKDKETWLNIHEKPHRENGPAIIEYDKDDFSIKKELWIKEGKLHRELGPAVLEYDSYGNITRKVYWFEGKMIKSPKQLILEEKNETQYEELLESF